MNYNIHIIPHEAQRNREAIGDYYLKHAQETSIRISDFTPVTSSNPFGVNAEQVKEAEDYEFLVMIHELVEAHLVRREGISYDEVDNFDTSYAGEGEPGDSSDAPYNTQHIQASLIEKYLAQILGVDWEKYSRAVDQLSSREQEIKD